MGIGGGLLLLAAMASMVPVSALIPVHGLVQLGSNGNRALMTWRHTDYGMVKWFAAGALVATVIAGFVVVQLPLAVLQLLVGIFILFMVWGSKPERRELSVVGRIFAGFFTTFLTMFVGATGPLVAAFVHRNGYHKMQIMATFAHCMVVQNILKAGVFVVVGFAFTQWLPIIIAMIAAGTIGTWLGLKLNSKLPAERFQLIFKIVVSLLAARLLFAGVKALIA